MNGQHPPLLHDAEPPRVPASLRGWLDDRAAWSRWQAAPMLSAADIRVVNVHRPALGKLALPGAGPGRFDFQPRNWLTDRHGILRVIDFEHA
jgi:hypothetical protein